MPRLRRAQLAHVTFCEPNKKEEWQSSPGQDLKSPLSMQAKHKTSRRLLIRAARLSWSQETFPSPPIEQHSHLQLPNLKAGWMTARYQLEICPKARLSLTFTTLLCLLRGHRAILQPFPHIELLENIPEQKANIAAPPSVSRGALPTASLPQQHGTSTPSSRTSTSMTCIQQVLSRTGVLPL